MAFKNKQIRHFFILFEPKLIKLGNFIQRSLLKLEDLQEKVATSMSFNL